MGFGWIVPGFALDPAKAPPHLSLARDLLAAIVPERNLYDASPTAIVWPDEATPNRPASNRSVCSSFGAAALRKAYGISKTETVGLFGEIVPEADDFFAAIRAGNRFSVIHSLPEASPGDFLVIDYRSDKAIPTGHVMLIDGSPRRVADHRVSALPWRRPKSVQSPASWPVDTVVEWHVAIIDSTKSPHGGKDSRKDAESDGANDSGLGRGEIRLLTDDSGKLLGYTWSTLPRSIVWTAAERPLIIGRFRSGA